MTASSSAIGGKSSVSKRHQKKPRRGGEQDMIDDGDEIDSDQIITRLLV